MKKLLVVFFVVLLGSSAWSLSSPGNLRMLNYPVYAPIRQIAEDRWPDGSVQIGINLPSHNPTEIIELGTKEFQYLTNDRSRMSIVHPEPDVWDWHLSDPYIPWINGHDQYLTLHAAIGPQCGEWAKNDDRTAEELELLMREYLQAVCERYYDEDRITYMDVVNETIIKGEWFGPKEGTEDWENPWPIMGFDANGVPSYIRIAFEVVNEYASPNMKLIFSHHEEPASDTWVSWQLIGQTITYLRSLDLRVDAVGCHYHIDVGWETASNVQYLRNLINGAHGMGLEFHANEVDVFIKNDETYYEQADTYRAVLETLFEFKDDGIIRWTGWSLVDSHCWRPQWEPGLFYESLYPKPSYHAIRNVLIEQGY